MSELAIDHEQQFLGCMLYGETANEAGGSVRPEHFVEPFHGRLWAAMQEQAKDCGLYDITALAGKLSVDPAFPNYGLPFLADLVEHAPPLDRAEHPVVVAQRRVHVDQ